MAVTRRTIADLASRIDELAEALDPAPRIVRLVVDAEVIEALGPHAHDEVWRRHCEIYPSDARARDVVFIVTGTTRSTEGREAIDRASGEILAALRARLQRPLELTYCPESEC